MHVSPAKHSYGSVTDRWTDRRTDRQTTDKVIPMCRYALQATQKWQHSEECMCRLRNIAMGVWQTDGQTDRRTDGQSDPYVSLCFARRYLNIHIYPLIIFLSLFQNCSSIPLFFLLGDSPPPQLNPNKRLFLSSNRVIYPDCSQSAMEMEGCTVTTPIRVSLPSFGFHQKKKLDTHVLIKHRCPRQQLSQNLAKTQINRLDTQDSEHLAID